MAPKDRPKSSAKRVGLSFTEKHRLDVLPGIIARLEAEIAKLSLAMDDADMFTKEPVKFRKTTEALSQKQALLTAAEEEWLMLEERV